MSTAWDGPDGQHGSLAKHVSVFVLLGGIFLHDIERTPTKKITLLPLSLSQEWKGFGKNGLSLEDAIEKSIQEASR